MTCRFLLFTALIALLTALSVHAEESPLWSGEGELGFLMTGGNSETESVNAKFDITYERASWRHNGHLEAFYSAEEKQSEADELQMETSAQKYLISAKTDYKFTENNYVFLTGTYEDDRFSGYDYQTSTAAGYGRRLFKTERMLMEIEVGPGFRYNKTNDRETEEELIIRGYGLFTTKLTETSSFKQTVSVEAGGDQTVTKSISSVKAQVVGALSMKLSFTAEHSSTVPEDTDKTDTETALTLVYSF